MQRTIYQFFALGAVLAILALSALFAKSDSLNSLLASIGALSTSSREYYVSSMGNDGNTGLSPTSAWKSIAKVNATTFNPGDRILFEGGKTFGGSLYFNATDVGSAAAPITITSYGAGRAIISSGAENGLFIYNTAGYNVENINFVGAGYPTSAQNKSGILFYTDLAGGVKLPYININNVEASGYGRAGITIGAWNGTTGYKDITITNVDVHDNATAGISIYGYASASFVGYAHENLHISRVRAHDNKGILNFSKITGNGIVVGQVNHGVIERSVAYNNGINHTLGAGPVGIWAWNSNDITIQYNESHHNHTSSPSDGGGFDLDGGVTNSIVQYNYAHDNDGPGLLLAQYSGTSMPYSGNIFRYNILQNNGMKNNNANIAIWNGNGPNGIQTSQIYNNTIYTGPSVSGTPRAVRVLGSEAIGVTFKNNIFVTTSGLPLVDVATPSGIAVRFENNNYYSSGSAFAVKWAGSTYTSLSGWQSATGQEKISGTAVGSSINPQLTAPGTGGTLGDANLLNTLGAYKLLATSPVKDKGILPPAPPQTDYYGNILPQGSAYDIGAHEFATTTPPPSIHIITASAGTGGTISPSGAVSTAAGSNKSFVITPNTGYTIASVTVDGVNMGPLSVYVFTNVQAAHTIAAAFNASTVSDTTPPSLPTNLAAEVTGTDATLIWSASTDNVGVTGYKIFRGGSQVGTTPSTLYTDTGLTPGSTYLYKVAAYDAAGNTSSQSSGVSVTIPTTPPPPPPPPPPFSIGTRVETTETVNVRAKPSTRASKKLGVQPVGVEGVIVAGPTIGSEYTWWQVDFDTNADGWVAESYLMLAQ